MGQEKGIIAWMANNPVAANLLMIVVMIGGLAAINDLTKEVFPSFPTEMVTITVPYPGSSPEEVEAGIVRIIEEELLDLVGVKEISSVSTEGSGTVTVQMEAGTPMSRALVQIKTRVDGIASFPANAEEPIVDEVLYRTRAMNVSAYGDLDEFQLKELADTVRDELLMIPGITQVATRGVRDYEISIELSDAALQRYGLSFDQVVAAIQLRSRDLPGGKLRTSDGSITLRSMGQAYTAAEFSELNLVTRSDGTSLKLGDIATVRDGFEDQPVLTRLNGKPSVTLVVDRVGEQDVLAMTDNIKAYVAKKRANLPPGVELTAWADRSVILKGRINLMLKSAAQGAVLVMIFLALFLNTSLAFWVILGVPFSFLGALLVMDVFSLGASINVFSVFGFILVLGMLVDDGIVTAESAYAQLEDEQNGVDSVVRGVRRVAVATIFGALTTMIAFAPAALLTEGIGRLVSVLVPVVVLSLLFSLIETKLILPAHLRHIRIDHSRPDRRTPLGFLKSVQQACSGGLLRFSEEIYKPLLVRAVEYRYFSLAVFFAGLMLCLALVPAGIVRFVFFPSVPSDSIQIDLKMPNGTSWQKTHEYALRIEQAARVMNERYLAETGSEQDVIREMLTLSTNDTESELWLDLLPSEQRTVSSVTMAGWLREALGELSGIQSLIVDANAGPSGAPVDVELSGDDLEQLRAAARELKLALTRFDGLSDIRDTFDAGGPELDIQVTAEGEALGLGQVELARQVRQAFFGAEVQRVQRGRHEVRVYVRLPAEHRRSLNALHSLWIDVPGRGKVPFDVVGTAEERSGVSVINRFNRQRVVNVLSDLDKTRLEPGEVNAQIVREVLPPILQKYPAVSHRLSGQAEQQAESTSALGLGFVGILVMIYAALAVPLRSYGQPIIIMSVIPFGLTGAVMGHFIMGNDVSILSMIGMIGLTGIVVNDSLVLVDHINHRLEKGREAWQQAVVNGAARRFRPVVLTSITTFIGLVPIQLETAIQAQFVKPMAISVAFGVLFATFVTLVLVPVLYFVGRDIKALFVREAPAC
ncbi:efflux RND transporter permease subunit [Seongchinamella unica]|uniref:Efflux RND transporter permease subunit n=1 Tax=Seongchinamella unica TaxID=2547392 RepID=A0A4R5LP25_9GAMM|nr:efflux RND transporter permease subunit [Seongchinamella unica]TDG12129.1 efflux RND transporter permease subunit [Seongchinamella unica]